MASFTSGILTSVTHIHPPKFVPPHRRIEIVSPFSLSLSLFLSIEKEKLCTVSQLNIRFHDVARKLLLMKLDRLPTSLSLCSHTYTYTQSANSISNFPTRNSQSHRTLLQTELGQIIRSKEGGEERLRERERKKELVDGYGLIFGLIVRENEDVFSTDGEVSRSQIPFWHRGPRETFPNCLSELQLRHSANFTSGGRERERGKD